MNFIVIVIDTLRYDFVGANDVSDYIETPNIDKLVSRSWNFHRAFSASFPTIPHRIDLITGRYGAPLHPWSPLDCDIPTIPRVLAEEGYCTQLIHDTPHLVNAGIRFDYPFHAWTQIRGAEVDRPWLTDRWEFLSNWEFNSLFDPHPRDKKTVIRNNHLISNYVHANYGRKEEKDWNVAKLFLKASQFLKDNKNRDNFFLWVDSFDPHEPWDAPPEYVKKYDKTPGYNGKIDPRSLSREVRSDPDLPQAAKDRMSAMYAAKVSFMDKWLGEFLDTLEETGLYENTTVIFTADHGTNVGERPDCPFGKTNPVSENESHVPLVIYSPKAGKGESNIIVQPQDVFNTIMGILSEQVPEDIESFDILKQLRDGEEGKRDIALAGANVGIWERIIKGPFPAFRSPRKILFSVFTKKWRLGFTVKPENCELQELGTLANVAEENPVIVKDLWVRGINEMERRGLDPTLVSWLRSEGEKEFPGKYRITDAHPSPPGWSSYWNRVYSRK